MRFSVTRDDITEVVFEGRNSEDIAGRIQVAFSNGVPAIGSLTEGQKKITLTAPGGGAFETGKFYYIVAAPGALSNGFKLTFNTATQYAELVKTNSVTVKRGIFGSLENADSGLTFQTKEAPTANTCQVLSSTATTHWTSTSSLSMSTRAPTTVTTVGLSVPSQNKRHAICQDRQVSGKWHLLKSLKAFFRAPQGARKIQNQHFMTQREIINREDVNRDSIRLLCNKL